MTVVAAMSCQPNDGRPACSINTELPRITPVGAVDCGTLDFDLSNDPEFVASVRCANAAIQSQAPFVLKMKNRFIRDPNCPSNAFCVPIPVLSDAYVGEMQSGRYRVALFAPGYPGFTRDSTQDAGMEVDSGVLESFVRKECYPPAGAVLRQHIAGSPSLSIQCTIDGSSDLLEIHSLPNIASCPPR